MTTAPRNFGPLFTGRPERPKKPAAMPQAGQPKIRKDAPETSRNAGRLVAGKIPEQQSRVLDYVRSRGATGATNAEISDALGMKLQSVCPRRLELFERGLLKGTGERRDGGQVWISTGVRS